jgi:hypothetical protein
VKFLSSRWSKLTGLQRQSWDVYGQNVTVTNALGDSSKLSGVNWFVGNNAIRQQAGFPTILDGPAIFDKGNPDWSPANAAVDVGEGTAQGTLTLTNPIFPGSGTNSFLAIYASRPYSPGKSFFNGPYRFSDIVTATGTGSIVAGAYPINLAFVADGVFNGEETSNRMQFVVRLSRGDGRLSSPLTITV